MALEKCLDACRIIDFLLSSGILKIKTRLDLGDKKQETYMLRVDKGDLARREVSISEKDLESLVNRAINSGKANLNTSFQHEYNESDGSCDIYYMQYHRDVLVLSEYEISLEIKDNKPILMVDSKVTESPGEWY